MIHLWIFVTTGHSHIQLSTHLSGSDSIPATMIPRSVGAEEITQLISFYDTITTLSCSTADHERTTISIRHTQIINNHGHYFIPQFCNSILSFSSSNQKGQGGRLDGIGLGWIWHISCHTRLDLSLGL